MFSYKFDQGRRYKYNHRVQFLAYKYCNIFAYTPVLGHTEDHTHNLMKYKKSYYNSRRH